MSSINSITVVREKILNKLISPIVKNCKYSLESTKEFKNIKQIPKFDNNEFEVVSFDCVSLYTSVDHLVINKIIDKIYQNEDNFFPKASKTNIIDKKNYKRNDATIEIFAQTNF